MTEDETAADRTGAVAATDPGPTPSPAPDTAEARPGRGARLRAAAGSVRRGAAPRRRVLLWTTAMVSVLLLVAATVLYAAVVRPAQQTEQARVDGLTAARTGVEQVLSYQPASKDADVARARGLVTGDFGRQFDSVLDSVVRPALDRGVGTRTVVTRAGVVSAGADRVTALLYFTQEAARPGEPPRTTAGRAEVTVQRVDGRWLVSDLRNF
ncbi:hypothetical protein [Pseudonocardia sp. ICBG1293]|uniref:hypothetical protein n=1 Tax=Pseudonocardia sp. ICBG1293 TaxID=2844382 RepID=UPI001CD01F6F|nr:hypothetical protein [Pseudonocardia sp. ICBG1293]